MEEYLIVGLGNPGSRYENTRHNLGFVVVEGFAKKQGLMLKRGWRLNGRVASGVIGGQKVHLLLPGTYMNLSGVAVSKAINYYKIGLNHMLIVVDDVYVQLGAMRIRPFGSAGGHNGLKNIDASLGTHEYPRLRMGVGPEDGTPFNGREMALEDYVLAQFSPGEQQKLSRVVENSGSVIERWLSGGVEAASQLAGELNNRIK